LFPGSSQTRVGSLVSHQVEEFVSEKCPSGEAKVCSSLMSYAFREAIGRVLSDRTIKAFSVRLPEDRKKMGNYGTDRSSHSGS
jgi:hypothetical protein